MWKTGTIFKVKLMLNTHLFDLLLEMFIPASCLVTVEFCFAASEMTNFFKNVQEVFKKVSRMIQEAPTLSTN